MSSPNLDMLSVSLSHLINDPVATASTNGDTITSVYRTKFLNDGIRECLKKWLAEKNWMALRHYLKEGTASLTANSALLTAWTGTVWEIITAKNNTDSVFVYPVPEEYKQWLDLGTSPYIKPSAFLQYYTVDGGYFKLLDGTATSTDAITLRYIKEHSDLSIAAGASTVVYDGTCTTLLTAVSNFSGVLATHVGGRFVGTDTGGHTFDRLITAYVSSSAFTIDSAVTDDGATCAGYIIPPSQNDIEIDSQYWDEVLQEAFKIYLKRNPTIANIEKLKIAG